jgi:uncharacterized membrane protein
MKIIRNLRTNVITGILIILPLITTVYVFIKLFDLVDSVLPTLFHTVLPKIPKDWIPGVGIVLVLVFAYFAGLVAKNYFGRKMIEIGNTIIAKIPIINKIYLGVQQILDAAVTHNKKLFERPVLFEYPKAGSYCIGFVTSQTTGEIPKKIGEPMLSIFVPTTPNPTSGFLLFLPETRVIDLNMNLETAIKLVMSAGMVNSDQLDKTQGLYKLPRSLKNWNWFAGLKKGRKRDRVDDPRD